MTKKQSEVDWLSELLRTVRDAGALDDSYGAEDWAYSDGQIDRVHAAIGAKIGELLDEVETIVARVKELQAKLLAAHPATGELAMTTIKVLFLKTAKRKRPIINHEEFEVATIH